MVNFAKHGHDIDPCTYRCRICGLDELELILQAEGFIAGEFLPGESLAEFMKRTNESKGEA